MRCANIGGRFVILNGTESIDVAEASSGQFGPDPLAVLDRWQEFLQWAREVNRDSRTPVAGHAFGPPIPHPRQVFAIGLNYGAHAAEANIDPPAAPAVFTKFPASITGPDAVVALPATGTADWEVELVVVIGAEARNVSAAAAWNHVAGFTVGQDLSERQRQMVGPVPQFSLGKSYEGFTPIGPELVTLDELEDPTDLAIECRLNGDVVQVGRTSDLIFDVPSLIEHLSAVLTLLPGDLIFTGTPAGVGVARTPPVYLQPGDVLVSTIEGIGEISQQFRRA
ncbi:fumarylacetoacetate hydrolase family protein [Nocardioides alcanivorans]|uniref:fumarylacetoacetate hydrolase family protein n=1 Tax=Nocardioides alcanivorans TaxID=2897352 RepID=UPI001F25629B|nr:fumarylacetoacetate hydrolase family protein [Nocardioides alcanivorans]